MDEDFEEHAEISASEDEDDDRKHFKLLDSIASLDGKKNKPKLLERTVLASQISEFNFTAQNDGGKVNISELMGTIPSNRYKKQLKSVKETKKVVPVPLPKHQKEKLERSVAYEQVSKDVGKWNSIVFRNRQADQLTFPLDMPVLKIHTTQAHAQSIKPRTSLEKEVASLLRKSDSVTTNNRELTKAEERALKAMSLEEAKERLAELRKHRMLLSYKEAKAKWQKRIKSKKYHRVLRKERMKNEKKSLEELQKTDPEGYIEKLQSVDKQRVEERMSLKHRGGSKFMKKQMIYGKYNDQARQSIQEMIQKNKELTQKTEAMSDSESDGGVSMDSEDELNMLESAIAASDNPWMKASGHVRPTEDKVIGGEGVEENDEEENDDESEKQRLLSSVVQTVVMEETDSNKKFLKNQIDSENERDTEEPKMDKKVKNKKKGKKNKHKSVDKNEVLTIADNLDDLFEEFEKSEENTKENKKDTVKETLHEKIVDGNKPETSKQRRARIKHEKSMLKRKQKREMERAEKEKKKEKPKTESESENSEEEEEAFISENLERKKTMEDFENGDTYDRIESSGQGKSGKILLNEKRTDLDIDDLNKEEDVYVDPKKLMTLESKLDKSNIPNMVEDDNDIDDEDQQRMTIAQAFADDDVIEEFSEEKKAVVDRDKPKDIDLTLPGWGEWGGEGIKISKRKKRRFIIKAPPGPPRKDKNLGNVIISEKKDAAIAKYQVSDLPFPYTNVKQFEDSIRAPIGKTWNTETAFQQLVKPKVVTKIGAIINPMDKEETFKKEKMKRQSNMDLPEESMNSSKTKRRKK